MSFEVDGEYNTATVMSDSDQDEAVGQILSMMNSEAFVGDRDVKIMPDYHYGKGSVIGFTMPLKNRVAPATVGVDIGCGMTAIRHPGNPDISDLKNREELDEEIRKRVPVGFDVHDYEDQNYHMIEDFPYQICARKLQQFEQSTDFDFQVSLSDFYSEDTFPTTGFPFYGEEYYKDLLKRVEYDPGRATNSVGTLGGGNHFIEIGEDPSADENPFWTVIHSGSRGLGASIAEYWIERANQIRGADKIRNYLLSLPDEYREYLKFDVESVSDKDLLDWVQGGMGEDFVDHDALRDEYSEDDTEKIGKISDKLKQALELVTSIQNPTAYLEGEEAHGYIIDMVFAQTYAEVSRQQMAERVMDAWFEVFFGGEENRNEAVIQMPSSDAVDFIESIHNYIDFRDATIRKGACRAHEGEDVIIPMNMQYGTLICRGKGDPSWNNSAPHGAGRAMSRTGAMNQLDQEDFESEMEAADVYLSEHPLDEAPDAYKDPKDIEEAIGPTVEIEHRINPLISVKAE